MIVDPGRIGIAQSLRSPSKRRLDTQFRGSGRRIRRRATGKDGRQSDNHAVQIETSQTAAVSIDIRANPRPTCDAARCLRRHIFSTSPVEEPCVLKEADAE